MLELLTEMWHHLLDSAEEPDHQSPAITQHCDLDQDIEPFSGEDKLVSSVVDLRECKQDEDLLCPVPLLSSTQTPVPVVSTGTEIKQQNSGFYASCTFSLIGFNSFFVLFVCLNFDLKD